MRILSVFFITILSSVLGSAQTIGTQPAEQTDCEGNGVNFSVVASGTSLSYAWERKKPGEADFSVLANGSGISNATSANLGVSSIGNSSNPHQSEYRCKVTSGANSVYSNAAKLQVNKVSGTVPDQNLCFNQNLHLNLSGTAIQGSPASYQWQVNTGSGYVDIAGAVGTDLTISSANASNSGSYRCKITFPVLPGTGTCFKYSDVSVVSVSSCVLTVSSQPQNQTDCKGNGVSFSTAATGQGTITYQWQRKKPTDADFANIDGAINASLSVSSVGSSTNPHGSQYRCVISDANGTMTTNAATLSVNSVEGSLVSAQNICLNQPWSIASTSLSTVGSVTNKIWQFNSGSAWTDLSSTDPSSGAANTSQSGRYRVKYLFSITPSGTCIQYSNESTLNITDCQLVITTQPQNQTDCKGNGVSFSTAATGQGTITYQWQRKKPSDADFANIDGAINATLSVSSVGSSTNPHGSQYRCVISDANGTATTNAATLSVNSIEGSFEETGTCLGGSVGFGLGELTVVGNVLAYQWQYRQNTSSSWANVLEGPFSGTQTAHISWSNAAASQSGHYRCAVTFSLPNSSQCIEYSDYKVVTIASFPPEPGFSNIEQCQFTPAITPKFTLWAYHIPVFYTQISGGEGSTQIPKSDPNLAGTTIYYVSQRSAQGCEGPRKEFKIVVHPKPSPPFNNTPAVVTEGNPLVFSVQGENIRWWSTASSRTVLAPPVLYAPGKYTYYVSQQSQATGCFSDRVAISGEIKPIFKILAQPTDQVDCKGNGVNFELKAQSPESMTFQWQKRINGTFIDLKDSTSVSGTKTPKLSLSNVGGSINQHHDVFRCVVTSGSEVIISKQGQLSVNQVFKSENSPQRCVGTLYILKVDSVIGKVKSYTIQKLQGSVWQNLEQVNDTSRFTDIRYQINQVRTADAGTYRVLVEFVNSPKETCLEPSLTEVLTVVDKPAAFAKSQINICVGSPIKIEQNGLKGLVFKNETDTVSIDNEIVTAATSYYVALTGGGCRGPRTLVNMVPVALPKAFDSQTEIICMNSGIQSPKIGDRLSKWYTSEADLTASKAPQFSTNSDRKVSYWVSNVDSLGCESPKVKMTFDISPCVAEMGSLRADCNEFYSLSVAGNKWNSITDSSGKIWAEVNPRNQDLGKVSISFSGKNASVISDKSSKYLTRYFRLATEKPILGPVSVKIYYKSQDIRALNQVESRTVNDSLVVVRYEQPEDCDISTNRNLGDVSQVIYKGLNFGLVPSGDYYLSFETDKPGEFGISSNHHLLLKSFGQKVVDKQVVLTIKTAAEKTKGWLIISRIDTLGRRTAIDSLATSGAPNEYSAKDPFPLTGKAWYQIKYRNIDGIVKIFSPDEYINKDSSSRLVVYPNPISAGGILTLYIKEIRPLKIFLVNSVGDGPELSVSSPVDNRVYCMLPAGLSSGQYYLRIFDATGVVFTRKIQILN